MTQITESIHKIPEAHPNTNSNIYETFKIHVGVIRKSEITLQLRNHNKFAEKHYYDLDICTLINH